MKLENISKIPGLVWRQIEWFIEKYDKSQESIKIIETNEQVAESNNSFMSTIWKKIKLILEKLEK